MSRQCTIRTVDGKILQFPSIRAYLAWYARVAIYEPRGLQLLAKDSSGGWTEKAAKTCGGRHELPGT